MVESLRKLSLITSKSTESGVALKPSKESWKMKKNFEIIEELDLLFNFKHDVQENDLIKPDLLFKKEQSE